MFLQWAERIAATPASVALQTNEFVVPASQSLHIIGVAVLFTSAMLLNVRLLGFGATSRSASAVAATALPWMWRALLLCVVTGLLQTFIEPVREFSADIFWWKMLLIAVMALLTRWLQRALSRHGHEWDGGGPPVKARAFAVVSSLSWITIVAFGRFIGYV